MAKRVFKLAKASIGAFIRADMLHHAAAMTYYTALAFFPALLAFIALLGLLGDSQTGPAIAAWLAENGISAGVADAVSSVIETATSAESGTAVSLTLVIAALVALNASAKAFESAGKAINHLFGVVETRSWWRRRTQALVGSLIVVSLGISARLIFFFGEVVVSETSQGLGLSAAATTIWNVASIGLVFGLSVAAYAWVYWFAPNVARRYVRMLSTGAVVAVAIWMAGSALFFTYAANFGSYNATYGAFAAAVVFLVWLWLTNSAFLLGAAINLALREEAEEGFAARGRASFWPRFARRLPGARGAERAAVPVETEEDSPPAPAQELDRDSVIW